VGAAVPLAVDGFRRIHYRAHRYAHGARPGGALRQKSPRSIPAIAAAALLCANIITIGADFAGMSDAAQMLTGMNSRFFTVVFGLGITFAIVKFRYDQIALVLKWLALALCSYIIAAFVLKPHWWSVLRDTVIPTWPRGHIYSRADVCRGRRDVRPVKIWISPR
jgi:Mn2+/Fe2+ NRAMP family transporter